jgi:hypothetical protein
MKQFLRKLFGTRGSDRPAPRHRPVRLTLETLDERIVPSATGNQDGTGRAQADLFQAHNTPLPIVSSTLHLSLQMLPTQPADDGHSPVR